MIIRKRLNRIDQKRAQSILEYFVLTAVVVAALVAMNVYVQRSIQANLKMIEDQVNAQPQ